MISSSPECTSVTMKDYSKEATSKSDLEISHTVATPAHKILFEVDEKAVLLEKYESKAFHSVAAKLLYVSLQGQVDHLLAVTSVEAEAGVGIK